MAGSLPPGSPFFPPPPPHSKWSRQLLTPVWTLSPTPTGNSASSPEAMIGIAIGFVAFFLLLYLLYRCRVSSVNAAAHAAEAAAAHAARPRAPPQPEYWDNDEQSQQRRHRSDRDHDGRTQRSNSPTADLPSFTYNRGVRHNVTGSGDEAATCSVCLGAFQVGETVRLLPVCLHLYHVECIDPWLEAHSTCPICRSGTDDDPTMHGAGLLPPV